ncbi:MAG: ABC transporter permease [Candidatus Fermentithermobacillus carboniphilus]|uniref:ABC transporter permease n=1 Tax=Candidatus Fermentithermobacillus carboniphilus TaxID=3085328 RepID=A0AAT9LDE4_9FIRM|nr:MAG: ABC transporter permease [Candidatus Fermentithermobacillus carboniphilus]
MLNYVVRRLLQMIPLLIGISIINFTIMHLAPGDPVLLLSERNATPEELARIRALYGLDEPIHVQYVKWLGHVLKGDFGRSFVDGRPVMDHILERLPYTLYLNFIVMIIIYLVAIPVGVISALRQYSKFDHAVTFFTFLGQALPSFWFALLLIYAVGIKSNWLPIAGVATIGVNVKTSGLWATILDRAKYLILPVTVVSLGSMAGIARYMRSSMLEVIRQDYVRTARAKGLPEKAVIIKHALRNALLPIVTLLGFELPALFSGTAIIETIFSWPGLGLLSMRAIFQRDYQIVMAMNMIGATLMVLGNFLADILYVIVDPRIKYS